MECRSSVKSPLLLTTTDKVVEEEGRGKHRESWMEKAVERLIPTPAGALQKKWKRK